MTNSLVTLHKSTFEYLKPTDAQMETMSRVQTASAMYASVLDNSLPPGADKTYLLRRLREIAMWANVAITRNPDGSPRKDE